MMASRTMDSKGTTPMIARIRSSLYDFVLVLVLSVALGYVVLSGFDSSLTLRMNFGLEFAICAAFLVILFSGVWSRKARSISIVVAILYGICAIGVSLAIAPLEATPFIDGNINDVEGNYAIFTVGLLVISLLCYLLSRSRIGVVILAFAAVFCCSIAQFLYRDWIFGEGGAVAFLVALISSVALVIYRRYRICGTKTDIQQNSASGKAFLFGSAVSVLSTGLACILFFGLIAPLGLSTPVLKPFEYRIIPPIVEYTGTYDEYRVENPNEFTSSLNEREDATQRNTKGGSTPDQDETETTSSPLITLLQSLTIFNEDDWSEDFDPSTINRLRLGFLIGVILVILAIISAIVARICWREVRLRRIRDKSVNDQVVFLYDFLMSRFVRLGLGKPDASTPLEYAFDSRNKLVPFTRNTNKVDFVQVTLIYQRVVYGEGEVTLDEYKKIRRYYRAFFNNAHRYIGTPRWLWKFWRI